MLFIIHYRSHVASGYLTITAECEMAALAHAALILADTEKYGHLFLRDLSCFPVPGELKNTAVRVIEKISQMQKDGTSQKA